jgi:hypothetical protein
MPIYEYYCPGNNTIYQFFAKTLAQGQIVPRCPDNAAWPMEKMMSPFAVAKKSKSGASTDSGVEGPASRGSAVAGANGDPRLDAAMSAMESEFSQVDENDPRAMGRMMRRMAEMTGEKIGGDMEEVVRKLEEGADPDSLEEQFGADEAGDGHAAESDADPASPGSAVASAGAPRSGARHRVRARRMIPTRDPQLHDYL